ncbi:MAG: Multiple sugar transport system permease protein [Devosia sp.]|nr:Multiple sugar transport system permease protein [Devosia sp.]
MATLSPSASTLTRPARRSRSGSKGARKYAHLWFVLPGLLFFLAFMIYPALFALYVSTTGWTGLGNEFPFVGLDNFAKALTAPTFYRAASNNLIMFAVILIVQHTIGLFLAVQLNAKPRFMEFYRTVLFLPVIFSLVATGFIWTLMLSPHIGFINPVLKDLGLGFLAKNWLSDITWALPTVIFVQAWQGLGWAVIIYLSGLQNIPEEMTQAAEIDGASAWQTFWRITFPMLSPATTALTILTFIGTFRAFDVVYVLTGPIGSPAGRTDILGTLIYRTAFGAAGQSSADVRMSYAIAMSLIVFGGMAIISGVMIKLLRRREIEG